MTLLTLFANTGEVRRNAVTGEDDYGNPEGTVSTVVGTYAARFQHHNSWEDKDGRKVQVQNWRCYMVPEADVAVDDQIFWVEQSRLFEIVVVEPVYDSVGVHHKYMFLQEIF